MRTLFGAVCFAGIIATTSSVECMAPHFNFVSQSISGIERTAVGNTTHAFFLTEKIDFENFNMFISEKNVTMTYDVDGFTWDVLVNFTNIMNMGERRIISYEEVSDPVLGDQTFCYIQALPDYYPDAATLALFYKAVADAAECSNNDGTHDTWKISKSFLHQSVDVEIVTTQDLLWHSVSESVTLNGTEQHDDMSIWALYAKAGGPSAADLDPAQFDVECKEIPWDFDANTLFSSQIPRVFQRHVLAMLQMALKSQQTPIVA